MTGQPRRWRSACGEARGCSPVGDFGLRAVSVTLTMTADEHDTNEAVLDWSVIAEALRWLCGESATALRDSVVERPTALSTPLPE